MLNISRPRSSRSRSTSRRAIPPLTGPANTRQTLKKRGRTSGRAIGLALAGLAMTACAADGLKLQDSPTSASSVAGGAYGNAADSGSTAARAFNPFGDDLDSASTGREVIAQPTRAQIMETGPLPEIAFGRADAPVTVIKYASLTCPICRKFQADVFPRFKKAYIDTGKVRFIIREFPIGRSSGNATIALRCAPKANYLKLYNRFLAQQSRWVSQEVRLDRIHAVAKPLGLSRAQFDACLKNREMIAGLEWIKNRGRKLGIIGTPNFFIGTKRFKKALGYEALSKEVDLALKTALAGSR